ncbi:peptidase, M48 family protein [Streptomyces populi]|uniref:Peptidase, M48 family protein n=1 Tax=Streptomyces populi TaxID=2058924 RepID=A0A2I0SF45_9ACTN|nr:M48 family metallopeptidase [Streptomyces populi]PKT68540.1 peptidase, M48 family protein [Streptomyces populi]
MHTAVAETVQPCPDCGAEVRGDSRFPLWCAACDWNVDPERPEEKRGRIARARHAQAQRHGERLLAELSAGGALRARRDSSAVLAVALALVVHALTLSLTAGGVWLLVQGWGGWGMVPGAFLLALGWSLRPRFARLPENKPVLRRADAPELFALTDEVARVAGTRGVDAIAVDGEINASVRSYGVRGRRLLTLGLPLWEVLTPQQRIALLGHEMGHYVNGDTRHGLVVGTAYRSLTTWHYYFAPVGHDALDDSDFFTLILNTIYVVPRLLVRGVLTVLDGLTLRASQRAEYLADRTAARVGSTQAALELMEHLLISDSAAVVLQRESNLTALKGPRGRRDAATPADELWQRLAAEMSSVPERERARLRRAGTLRGHSVDATHPPTHLRHACLLTGEPAPAAVATDTEREHRIAGELAAARTTVARRILQDGY